VLTVGLNRPFATRPMSGTLHLGQNVMTEHTMPGGYLLYSVELAKRWHVTADALLADSGLDLDVLADPRTRVPISTITGILERARALTAEPAFGFYLGLQMRVSAHGFLGIAALSAPTMREAIDLSVRFMPVVTTALSMRLEVVGSQAALILDEHANFGRERDTVLLAALIGIWQIGIALSGHDPRGYADLVLPEPVYHANLLRLGPRIRFNQPANRLLFDTLWLDIPHSMAHPMAMRLARDECERLLLSRKPAPPTTARVRDLLTRVKGKELLLAHVARALNVSARTLKRQLAAEGSSFSALIDEERQARAMFLLASPDASLKDVAGRLGYANMANFTRAFARWTGQTPSAYRATVTSRGRGR
jgi:AraC-like DNA-binding protein